MLASTLWLWLLAPSTAARELPALGEALRTQQYRRIDDTGGRVRGRWRRSRAAWTAWELQDGTIVQLQHTERRQVVEERRFDATGWPLTTWHRPPDGLPRLEVHTVPGRELVLSGWTPQDIPGGSVLAPLTTLERDPSGARLLVLGGTFEVWHDPDTPSAFVYEPAFREGLASGCGCVLVDAASVWVDGQPGIRIRMEVPPTARRDPAEAQLLDLWAVPLGEHGVWLASYRAPIHEEEPLAMAPGRALISLTTLNQLDALVRPTPDDDDADTDVEAP